MFRSSLVLRVGHNTPKGLGAQIIRTGELEARVYSVTPNVYVTPGHGQGLVARSGSRTKRLVGCLSRGVYTVPTP